MTPAVARDRGEKRVRIQWFRKEVDVSELTSDVLRTKDRRARHNDWDIPQIEIGHLNMTEIPAIHPRHCDVQHNDTWPQASAE